MQYKILYEINLDTIDEIKQLEESVNKHIKKGWEPIGGVFIDEHGFAFQAMIKRG